MLHVASATAESSNSTTVEMADDDEFWKNLAFHAGPFAFVSVSGSAHILKWAPAPHKVTANGLIGFYEHLVSFPEHQSLAYTGSSRIHVCRQSPCNAMYHPSKYGQLPPPTAHGRVMRLLPCNSEDQWAQLAESLASATAEGSRLLANVDLPSTLGPHVSPVPAPLPSPAEPFEEQCEDPEPPTLPAKPECVASSIEEPSGVALLILARAAEIRRARTYSGLFDFVVWAAIRKRRVFLRFVQGVFDLVMTLAPQIVHDTWAVAPSLRKLLQKQRLQSVWLAVNLLMICFTASLLSTDCRLW